MDDVVLEVEVEVGVAVVVVRLGLVLVFVVVAVVAVAVVVVVAVVVESASVVGASSVVVSTVVGRIGAAVPCTLMKLASFTFVGFPAGSPRSDNPRHLNSALLLM